MAENFSSIKANQQATNMKQKQNVVNQVVKQAPKKVAEIRAVPIDVRPFSQQVSDEQARLSKIYSRPLPTTSLQKQAFINTVMNNQGQQSFGMAPIRQNDLKNKEYNYTSTAQPLGAQIGGAVSSGNKVGANSLIKQTYGAPENKVNQPVGGNASGTGADKAQYESSQQARYLKAILDQNYELVDRLEADSKLRGWKLPLGAMNRQNKAEQAKVQTGLANKAAVPSKTTTTTTVPTTPTATTQPRVKAATPEDLQANYGEGTGKDGYIWSADNKEWMLPADYEAMMKNKGKIQANPDVFQAFVGAATGIPANTNTTNTPETTDQTDTTGEGDNAQEGSGEEDPTIKAIRNNTNQELSALDAQIADAQRNMDFARQAQLEDQKRAVRAIADQSFQAREAATQQMANRGLLTSGMYGEAMLRTGMAANQNLRDLGFKQQLASNKLVSDMDALNKQIAEKRQKILSGEKIDIEKANQEIEKLSIEQQKLLFENRKMLLNNAQDALSRLAKDNKISTAPFEGFLVAGDLEGLANALINSPTPELNVVGRSIVANINLTKASIGVKQAQKQETQARAAKTYSDIFGFVTDANGKPIPDKDGKVMPTVSAQQAWAKIQQQAANSAATQAYRNDLLNLRGMELEERIFTNNEKLNQNSIKIENDIKKDNDKQRADFFTTILDSAKSAYGSAASAYASNKNGTTAAQLAKRSGELDSAINNLQNFYYNLYAPSNK